MSNVADRMRSYRARQKAGRITLLIEADEIALAGKLIEARLLARKYDIDVGDKTMFWMGMVPL